MKLIIKTRDNYFIYGARIHYKTDPRKVMSNSFTKIDLWSKDYDPLILMFETIIIHSMYSYIVSLK